MKIKKNFDWKPGARISIDPNVAGKALEQIERKQGKLTPQIVLKEASAQSHPLHAYFDWDDSAAAKKWRLQQAGHLVRCITVTIEDVKTPEACRAFVSVALPDDPDKSNKVFLGIERVMRDDQLRKQLLTRAKRELRDWQDRYADLVELATVFEAIQEVLELAA
jgi:hypothetical protein